MAFRYNPDENVEVTKITYQKIYKDYSSSNKGLPDKVKEMLDRFLSLLLTGKTVLDVGCAHGRESKYLFSKGCRVTGIDISDDFIRIANQNCPECNFIVMDMRRLDFGSKLFDGIWCQASFLHVPKSDAAKTLRQFNKVLKENGLLYLSVMQGSFNGLRPNKQLNWPERHFSDYQPHEMEKLIKDAGFTDISCDSNQTSWGPVFLHFFCRK